MNSSSMFVDTEKAIRCRDIKFEDQEIAFSYFANHGGTYKARDLVSKKWSPLSAGSINRISDTVLSLMVRHANGRCRCLV